MRTVLILGGIVMLGSGTAMADIVGTNIGHSAGLGDPYIFGTSAGMGMTGIPVDLLVTDANGQTYAFTTNFDEILPGVTDSGWWSDTAMNVDNNPNFIVSQGSPDNHNDYFTFNMSQNAISAAIASAALSIPTNYGCSPEPTCETSGLPVTYFVGSVSVSAAILAHKSASPNVTIYNDLRTADYGAISIQNLAAYANPMVITLDSKAITDLNSVRNTSQYFSVGGTLAPIPEPASPLLVGAVLLGLAALTRWRR